MVFCQKCHEELGDFPEDRVDRGELDEVIIKVEHTGTDNSGRISMSHKEFYCSSECFISDNTD